MYISSPTIKVSDRAADHIDMLNNNNNQFLRISIIEGGCAGKKYTACIDEEESEFDYQLPTNKRVRIVVDKNTVAYIDGLEIDYSDDLINLGFKFRNPAACKACGCGASFSA